MRNRDTGNIYTDHLYEIIEKNNGLIRYLEGLSDTDLPEGLDYVARQTIGDKIASLQKLNRAIGCEIRRLEDPSNPINYLRMEIPATHHYYHAIDRLGPLLFDCYEDGDPRQVEAAAIEILSGSIHSMHEVDFDRMCEVAEALAKHGCTKLMSVVKSEGVLEQIAANKAARIAEKFS